MKNIRLEKDTLGTVKLDKNAYYGAQTKRALDNFKVSGQLPDKDYTYSIVLIKKAAALTNYKLGKLSSKQKDSIIKACNDILLGRYMEQFQIDPYQAGAGTSQNMNVNEVIANVANEYLGAPLGSYRHVHPNNHVNMAQSTNDVIPTAIRIACLKILPCLFDEIKKLEITLSQKSKDFSKVLKSGRTHLQDALPITLGQEFSGYQIAISKDLQRLKDSSKYLLSLGIGGSGVGTGINTHPDYAKMMVSQLKSLTGFKVTLSSNLFESMQNSSDFLQLSTSIRTTAQDLIRIGNDLRLLSSGPDAGLAEINLPAVQPGSSIMPGKVNPSIIEMMTMVCIQIIGFDQSILIASMSGQLELNVMLPLIALNIISEIKLLTQSIKIFNTKCLKYITANRDNCFYWFEKSTGIAAVLSPYLGYEKTAIIVREAIRTKKSIKELVIENGYISKKEAERIFAQNNITGPNIK